MMHGILAWEAGTIRLYECTSVKEAAAIFDRMGEYDAVMQVLVITASTALLRGAMATKEMGRGIIKNIARQLQRAGFAHALMERSPEHRMPYASLITEGPLAGLWHLELAHIVGGNDGDY